jgi:hypothetical protein
MDDSERVRLATGKRPATMEAVVGHGAPSNRRWRVTFDDGTTAFAKIAVFDYTADWLRIERDNYEALSGQPYISSLLGWHDDGDQPALVIDDMTSATWPPPWTQERIDAVRATLDEIRATPPPAPISALFGAMFDIREGWSSMRDHPAGALALGVFDEGWLGASVDTLVRAAEGAELGGDALLHGDVRSDNLCMRDGRAVLVDWNWACRGAPALDLIAWLPSLHHEGGPPPWELAPGEGALAALLAGFFLEHAGRDPIPQAPHVRQLQRDQGVVALAWACHELGLPPPHVGS